MVDKKILLLIKVYTHFYFLQDTILIEINVINPLISKRVFLCFLTPFKPFPTLNHKNHPQVQILSYHFCAENLLAMTPC